MLKLDIQMFADGVVEIETVLGTKKFDSQIEYIERKLNDMIADYETLSQEEGFNKQSNEAIELRKNIEKTTEQLERLKKKQTEINDEGFKGIGSSLTKVTKKVAKWGLALFGIRSAYMFIRQSMSTLSQYNQDLANKIQTIKVALATALEPIIVKIVNWVYKLIGYLGYFIKRWTGFDIFKNSAKALKSGASSAKQIRKELAGFDEMNILGQNTTASGGASANFKNPLEGLDATVLEKINNFVDKLNELGITSDKIKDIIKGIIAVVGAIEVGKIVAGIAKIVGVAGGTAGLYGIVAALGAIDLYLIGWVLPKKIKETSEALKKLHEAEQDEMDITIKGMSNSLAWLEKNKQKLDEINRKKETGRTLTKAENTLLQQQKANEDNVSYSLTKVNTKVKDGYKLTESQKLELDKIKANYQALDKKTFKNDINTKVTMTLEEDKKNASFWTKLKNNLSNMVNKYLTPIGGTFHAKGAIYYPSMPKLASGGIINRPGAGVPYHGAYIGERGAEAVVPLTDSQQMELLGATIGKYISINATVPVYVGNRQIAREIRKIEAEESFGFNR